MTRPTLRHLAGAAAACALLLSARGEAQKPEAKKEDKKATSNAKKPALPAGVAPFEIAPITGGSWYGRFGLTNCSWVDAGDGVVLIDTGGTPADAENLKKQVKETTNGKPVRWIVLTHLHGDSNNGLKTFFGPETTIFANARVAPRVAQALQGADPKAKVPTVVGVEGHSVLVAGGHRIDLVTPPGAAHSAGDLVAFNTESGVAYVGDLVTPGRCPMMSDPDDDPNSWLTGLDSIQSVHPALLIPTRGDASKLPESDIVATRNYIRRVLDILLDMKKKNMPEARVGAELQLKKVGDYCPGQLDNINAVRLYKRLDDKGNFEPGAPEPPKKK